MAKLKDIVFDCVHAAPLARFWADALDGFEVRPYDDAEVRRLAELGFTPETDPTVMVDGPRYSLCFQQVPDPRIGRDRLRLHLDAVERATTVARLVGLGASVLATHVGYSILADPEGNEFRVHDAITEPA